MPIHAQEETETDCTIFMAQEICESVEACAWEEETCINNPLSEPQSELPLESKLETPSIKQVINIAPAQEEWSQDKLQTFGIKFLIRSKEALSWSLGIKDSGFETEGIKSSYIKVLTIVNSLFILGLLAIAAMWMFSILIPRRYLKKVILIYAGAVIFVNFALPVNQLLISGTNLLQKTLLTSDGEKINITNIIETPDYEEAIAYRKNDETSEEEGREIRIEMSSENEEGVNIGTIESGSENIVGTLVGGMGNQNIELDIPPQTISLNPEQSFKIIESSEKKSYSEQSIFTFLMFMITAVAYFILALIFIIRIVILWGLLILSPALILLSIFKATRGWFINWLSLYGRWLLIGPLIALGIAIIIGIWESVGLPIESSHEGGVFVQTSNISFFLPGEEGVNTLSGTDDMMNYLVFLMMLYLPIFFAFALTRKKMLQSLMFAYTERKTKNQIMTREVREEHKETKKEKTESISVMDDLKDFVNSKISKVAQVTMPKGFRSENKNTERAIPSASSFLPEQLKLTDVHGMLELIGSERGSRKSREKTIEKLASPEKISNYKERNQVKDVRNEIESKAAAGNVQAIIVMEEIKVKESEAESRESTEKNQTSVIPNISNTTKTDRIEKTETGTEKIIERVIEKKEKETMGNQPTSKQSDTNRREILNQKDKPLDSKDQAGEATEDSKKTKKGNNKSDDEIIKDARLGSKDNKE